MENCLEPYHKDNWQKLYKNPHNGRMTLVEVRHEPLGQFVVRAGANSEYSYTGSVGKCDSIEEAKTKVDSLYLEGKLFK